MNLLRSSIIVAVSVLGAGSIAVATPIDVNIDGEVLQYTQSLDVVVDGTPTKKPSGRTLISGLSYWTAHDKFGSAGLEPDPISSFTANSDLDAAYDTILVHMGFDNGLTTTDGESFTSKSIRDVKVSLRDEASHDLLVLSSTSANNTQINGNKGGLFEFNTGANGGAYVETLFTVTGGALASTLLGEQYFGTILSGAMHSRAKNDLYFTGMDFTLYGPDSSPPTEVPEPLTAAGLTIGLGAAALRKRRQKLEA